MDPHIHTRTWRAGACEVASFTPLSDVGAGAVVATRSVVAGIEFLAEDSRVAVLTLAIESALSKHTHLKSTSLEGEAMGDGDERKKNS